jgi:xylulokinase
MGLYIGVDIGTSGTKSLLINESGEILAEASATYGVLMPKPMWTEQDPEEWWTATKKTIRAVLQKAKVDKADVKSIGLSGQMHGSVFLDSKNSVIRPALLWNDQRTAAECAEITQLAGGRKKLIKLVANPALTGFTAPKILWLRNNEPKNFDRLTKVLLPKDDVRRRLTGEFATDVSDASGMLLLNVVKRRWSKKLMSKLELDPTLFADVYESQDVTGKLLPEVANELGLTTDCTVVAGAGDCAAGAVGNGIVASGILTASLGTSGVMFAHSDEPQYDTAGRLHTFCHAVKGKWHMMGVTLSAAGSLQWFMDNIVNASSETNVSYETINAEASEVNAGSDGLFFLPYLAGERTPHADPNARGCWIGLTNKHGRGHLARSVMEGVSYSLNESLAIIKELGVPVDEIRLSGGGAKSDVWKDMLSDIFAKEVSSINAEQGPAFGVALLAAVGDGAFGSIEEACQATIRVVSKRALRKKAVSYYAKAFPIYQRFYGDLQKSFSKINELDS